MERIIHERFQLKISDTLNYPPPLMIDFDEHTIHKGEHSPLQIADLDNYRIYNIIEGRSLRQVERKFKSYRERNNVKMVCMDLSSSYRAIIEKSFPNATIVVDHFHVIRMFEYHFIELCTQAQQCIRWKHSIIHPLRKRGCNLSCREK